jgi:hypothetical protein
MGTLKKVFQEGMSSPKGRLHNYYKHPYYLCFHDLVSSVLSEHAHRQLGEIAFAFDRQDKMLPRCIRMYEAQKKTMIFHPQLRLIAGRIIESDDKVGLPIQAADLIAWQTRNRSWPHTGRVTDSANMIAASKKVHYNAISPGDLRYFVKWANWSPAMRATILRFSGFPVPTIRRIGPKNEN